MVKPSPSNNKRGSIRTKGKGNPCLFCFGLFLLLRFQVLLPALENTEPGFPFISRLDPSNVVFKQYLADVETARRLIFTGNTDAITEYLTVYAYTPAEGDDVYGLAARCNIPYAALVTLNRLPHPTSLAGAGTLLLPSIPGIFIPETPESDLERLLFSTRDADTGISLTFNRQGQRAQYRFIPGADFSATERAFFLNTGFRFPLRNYRLTSSYGLRVSPITGNLKLHEGLDLAAPLGTEVFAARDGVVTEIGEGDAVFGNYIIIQHSDNWVSLYGHLSTIDTHLRSTVQTGTLIGSVGSTGLSTGPHLHFELRQNGRAQDPGKYLFKEGTGR
ncbi:peptidase M23 [Spirochaetia bacterium]|nr:peptidase M23 [Spirochaetia bacterium]